MLHKSQGLFQNIRAWVPDYRDAFSHILVSLKNRNFRLYFVGMCVSLIGTWMQQIAMSWLVYNLTGSVLLLATVTFMAQIPILLVTPFMSVFIDRFDRRRILVLTQSLSMLQALLMALLTLTGTIEVWHILALSLLIGCINALDNPTRQAFYPSLVAKENLSNAIALNSAVINGSRLIGPAVGGVLIGLFGEGLCFLLNGISYMGVLIALFMMRLPASSLPSRHRNLLSDIREGFSYVSGALPLRTLLLMMSVMSFFGLPLMTFIPAYVKDILSGESEMLGLMLSSIGIGSFAAAIYLAARKSVLGLEKVVTISGFILGMDLAALALVHLPWLALLLCIPAGFSIISTVASINTLLQTLSDEDKRGRVMGYLAMTFTGIAPLGSMALGALEKYIGLPAIIFLSGICCMTGAWAFRHYCPMLQRHTKTVLRKGLPGKIVSGTDRSDPN